MKTVQWIDLAIEKPRVPKYYFVKFDDGTTDEKPYRIRPSKNIDGFMTEKNVTHWAHIPEDFVREEILD